MTTFNTGYPYSNLVAVPPVMDKPVELGGRVRVAYGKVTIPAASVPGTGDIVNITKLPLGAKILSLQAKWEDLNSGSDTLTLKAGTTAISAALNVGTAQSAYAFDYTGVGVDIDTEAKRLISATLGGAALNGTAGNKFEFLLTYALD